MLGLLSIFTVFNYLNVFGVQAHCNSISHEDEVDLECMMEKHHSEIGIEFEKECFAINSEDLAKARKIGEQLKMMCDEFDEEMFVNEPIEVWT